MDSLEKLKLSIKYNGIPWNELTEEQRKEVMAKAQDRKLKVEFIINGTTLENLDSELKIEIKRIIDEAIVETLKEEIDKRIVIIEKSLAEIKALSFNALDYIKDKI